LSYAPIFADGTRAARHPRDGARVCPYYSKMLMTFSMMSPNETLRVLALDRARDA
jgi:hypothetical protein